MLKQALVYLCICIFTVNSKDYKDLKVNDPSGNMFYSTASACYNKFVGSTGSIQSPMLLREYQYPVNCQWDIEVADSNTIELEFETFNLPKSKERSCESYIVMSFMKNQDEMSKKVFCPYDLVGKIYTDSNKVLFNFHSGEYSQDYGNDSYGFKINYNAIPVNKPTENYAGTIVLISFVTLCVITICIICIRSYRKSSRTGPIPSRSMVIPAASNAPTRADLQSAFDFHVRQLTQAPLNGTRYLSRTANYNLSAGDLADQKDGLNLPRENSGDRQVSLSITTTPRSVFPATRRGLSAESARRIADLRTRLVARFSSGSSNESCERSVFFSARDQLEYSQLTSDEEKLPEDENPRPERRRTDAGSGGGKIPSIVIEFFK